MAIKTTKCLRPGICRKHRPNCRHCRRETLCNCGGMIPKAKRKNGKTDSSMPHRKGSKGNGLGCCEHHPDHYEQMMKLMLEPIRVQKAG